MRINLSGVAGGNRFEVVAGVPDIVAWEFKTKNKMSDWSNGIGLNDMCFMAWNVLKRTNETPLPYETWLNTVESIEANPDDPKDIPAEA
jgi:hypothetical protein